MNAPVAQRRTHELNPCRKCSNTFWTEGRSETGVVELRCTKCGRSTRAPRWIQDRVRQWGHA